MDKKWDMDEQQFVNEKYWHADGNLGELTRESTFAVTDPISLAKIYFKLFIQDDLKDNTIEQRMQTAIKLIGRGMNTDQKTTRFTMAMAAIESLVVNSSNNVTEMFSRNISTLLEPDASSRKDAKKYLKKLYGMRCGVLHGRLSEVNEGYVSEAQQIACSILSSYVEILSLYKNGCSDLTSNSSKDLFRLFDKYRKEKQPFFGIADRNVRKFWNDKVS